MQPNHDNVSYVRSQVGSNPYNLTCNAIATDRKPLHVMETVMPIWSNSIPEKTKQCGYDLRRTPADKPIKGLITCNAVIGCYTHWWGGRTVPCEGKTCEACKANTPARWHCYLSILESGTRDHFIFECTGKAANPLIEWLSTEPTLRGVLLYAHRPKRRRNSRVEIILTPRDNRDTIIPTAPDLVQAMSVIWQLPGTALKTDRTERQTTLIEPDATILNKQRLNPADGNGQQKRKTKVKK